MFCMCCDAVLLTLMLACLHAMFAGNLHRRDLAVRYSAGSVRCSAHAHGGMFK